MDHRQQTTILYEEKRIARMLVSQLRYTPYGETRPDFAAGAFPTDRRCTGQWEESALGMYDGAVLRSLTADHGRRPQLLPAVVRGLWFTGRT